MRLREFARATEHARNATLAARRLKAVKYHGKWPFTRLLGMQARPCPPDARTAGFWQDSGWWDAGFFLSSYS